MAVSTGDHVQAGNSRLDGLAAGGVFTWDDLQAMPEDRFRWELVDGQLLVTPAPRLRHQRVVRRLSVLLAARCPADLEVVISPCDWVVTPTTVFVPDLMVVRRDEVDRDIDGPFTGTPLLMVEVRSPSTAATDRTLKRQQYQQHGVPAYWLVDPGGPRKAGGPVGVPNLSLLRLEDGQYAERAVVEGDDPYHADFPFPVTVVPGQLVG